MRRQWLYAPALFAAVAMVNIASSGVAHAGTQTCTWTGGGANSNWSTAANWSCDVGTVPADGAAMVFPLITPSTGQQINSVNDLSATNSYTGLSFSGGSICTAGQTWMYHLSGNALKLAGDISVAYSGNCYGDVSITNNLTLASNASVSVAAKAAGVDRVTLGDEAYGAEVHPLLDIGSYTLTMKGAQVLSNISGTGNILVENYVGASSYYTVLLDGDSSNFHGDITVQSGAQLSATTDRDSLGMNYGKTIVNNDADLYLISGTRTNGASPTTATLKENIDLLGSSTASGWNPKLAAGQCVWSYPSGYTLLSDCLDNGFLLTYTGTLTLSQNATVQPFAESFTIAGPIVGNFTLSTDPRSTVGTGAFIINSSSNGSATPNGTYTHAHYSTTLSDSQGSVNLYISNGHTVIVDGIRGDIILNNGGILKGSGTVGTIDITPASSGDTPGGHISPGSSLATLNSGNVTLDTNSSLDIELGGTTAGQYDQLNVTGTVNLAGAMLNTSLYNSYAPALNSTYTIINNDGSDAIAGTFAGLAQGASFTVDGYTFTISYSGGTGNDVVLTTTTVPAPPNTAGVLARPVNVVLAALVIATGIGIMVTRRVILKKTSRR